jgi:hypothetical protein
MQHWHAPLLTCQYAPLHHAPAHNRHWLGTCL